MPEIPKLMIRIEFTKPDGTYFVGYAVYDRLEEAMEAHSPMMERDGVTCEMTVVEIPEAIRQKFENAVQVKELPFH